MNLIEAVLQSAAALEYGPTMTIKVVRVDDLRAGRRHKRGIRLMGANAPCIGKMDNTDSNCVARSIVYAMARLEQNSNEDA